MSPRDRTAIHMVLLVLLGAAVYLPALGQLQRVDDREARHAGIARTMLETGVYSVPYVNGEPYIDKPPLYNWAEAFLFALFGRTNFLLARLPSALSAMAAMLGIYVLGMRWLSRRAGMLAALIWATSYQVIEWGRFSRPDVMLAALVLLGIVWADSAAAAGPGWRRTAYWCGASVAIGLATLSKGPQAIFFWAVAVFALWPTRAERRLPPLEFVPIALVIIGAIVVAWLVPAEHYHPGHLRELLGYQFGKGLVEHPKRMSLYFDQLLIRTAPWSFFAAGAAYWIVRRLRRCGYEAAAVPAVVTVVCLIALTILPNKRSHYVLPAAPMWALFLGMFLDRVLVHRQATSLSAPAPQQDLPPWTFEWPLAFVLELMCAAAVGSAVYLWLKSPAHGVLAVIFFVLLRVEGGIGVSALYSGRPLRAFAVLCALAIVAAVTVNLIMWRYLPQPQSPQADILAVDTRAPHAGAPAPSAGEKSYGSGERTGRLRLG